MSGLPLCGYLQCQTDQSSERSMFEKCVTNSSSPAALHDVAPPLPLALRQPGLTEGAAQKRSPPAHQGRVPPAISGES